MSAFGGTSGHHKLELPRRLLTQLRSGVCIAAVETLLFFVRAARSDPCLYRDHRRAEWLRIIQIVLRSGPNNVTSQMASGQSISSSPLHCGQKQYRTMACIPRQSGSFSTGVEGWNDMKSKLLGLMALVSLVLALSSGAAGAGPLPVVVFDWSTSGPDGSGTFTTTNDGSDEYTITRHNWHIPRIQHHISFWSGRV